MSYIDDDSSAMGGIWAADAFVAACALAFGAATDFPAPAALALLAAAWTIPGTLCAHVAAAKGKGFPWLFWVLGLLLTPAASAIILVVLLLSEDRR